MNGTGGLDRAGLLERLGEARRWDMVVIGGGATGLGCAVDAAARGHSTLLLEARDFAAGTSSRSTKLIHGGVRYLAQGRLRLVREALRERARLLANAPHRVRPLRFIVPTHGFGQRTLLSAGLGVYDLLAGSHRIAPHERLDAAALAAALPGLRSKAADGAVAYWDAQFDDALLAIALMRSVFDLGGLALNHVAVEGLLHRAGRIAGVTARDAESGRTFEVAARAVINATGVWADRVRRLDDAAAQTRLRPSQGAHVVVDADFLPGNDALLIPRTADGRVLFVLPWHGRRLIGTTDTALEALPDEPHPLASEIDFLLDTAGRHLARVPRRADVRSAFAGVRPLIGSSAQATARLSREHRIEVSHAGLVTITGGKWTTYRRMAEDAVNAAESAAGLTRRGCITARMPLHGAGEQQPAGGAPETPPLTEGLDLSAAPSGAVPRRTRRPDGGPGGGPGDGTGTGAG
jgi:glycerol-3-phosphate dehydrogenase